MSRLREGFIESWSFLDHIDFKLGDGGNCVICGNIT